jgi:hypothetical protein
MRLRHRKCDAAATIVWRSQKKLSTHDFQQLTLARLRETRKWKSMPTRASPQLCEYGEYREIKQWSNRIGLSSSIKFNMVE